MDLNNAIRMLAISGNGPAHQQRLQHHQLQNQGNQGNSQSIPHNMLRSPYQNQPLAPFPNHSSLHINTSPHPVDSYMAQSSPSYPTMTPQYVADQQQQQLHEIFIGNLSYFCQEQDLINLFHQYVDVKHCRVMRSDDGSRSLLFGFVSVATVREMEELCKMFDFHFLFGRRLR